MVNWNARHEIVKTGEAVQGCIFYALCAVFHSFFMRLPYD